MKTTEKSTKPGTVIENSIGNIIAAHRERLDMSVSQIAKSLCVPDEIIVLIESDQLHKITHAQVYALPLLRSYAHLVQVNNIDALCARALEKLIVHLPQLSQLKDICKVHIEQTMGSVRPVCSSALKQDKSFFIKRAMIFILVLLVVGMLLLIMQQYGVLSTNLG